MEAPLTLGIDLDAVFNLKQDEKHAPLSEGILLNLVHQLKQISPYGTKIILVAEADAQVATAIIDSLTYYQLSIDGVLLTTRGNLLLKMREMGINLYFATDYQRLKEVQEEKILGAYVNLKQVNALNKRFAFHHRLFSEEDNSIILSELLRQLGNLQKVPALTVSVELITTRYRSVEDKTKQLFKELDCSLDAICFLASGNEETVLHLFEPTVYLEGKPRAPLISPSPPKALMFI